MSFLTDIFIFVYCDELSHQVFCYCTCSLCFA